MKLLLVSLKPRELSRLGQLLLVWLASLQKNTVRARIAKVKENVPKRSSKILLGGWRDSEVSLAYLLAISVHSAPQMLYALADLALI